MLKSSGLDDRPEIRLATILGDSRTGLLSDLETLRPPKGRSCRNPFGHQRRLFSSDQACPT